MSERRDYSDVKWPWDGDPNWGPPREAATSNVEDNDNWALACGVCALRFPMEIRVETVAAHWDELHAPEHGSSEDGHVRMSLVWIGLGSPPQPPEEMGPST